MSVVLSSDALEQQFGPTELEILQQDASGRIICTKVIETGKILEISQVVFRPAGISSFKKIHQHVLSGVSMGKAFASEGVPFHRNIHASYRYDQHVLPAAFGRRFGTNDPPTITDLSVIVGPDGIPYADILEVYSPHVNPWELTRGDMRKAIADRLEIFGAELADLNDTA